MSKKKFNACLEVLRSKVRGKRFDEAPELFKDIESLKAKMRAIYNPVTY